MKPLSERDENKRYLLFGNHFLLWVGMKPLSERDENTMYKFYYRTLIHGL